MVHLGLYETPWLAGLAYLLAAREVQRDCPPLTPPTAQQPTAEEVREITLRIRRRLGMEPTRSRRLESPPKTEDLLSFFEVTVVGFWRGQAAEDHGGPPSQGLESAAGRLEAAARLLFWSPMSNHPDPLDAMSELLSRRLDREFGSKALTRAIQDDDGDDPIRVASWLVLPDDARGARFRGFRAEVSSRYRDLIEEFVIDDGGGPPDWAAVLGLTPPFTIDRVRAAYRTRSMSAHPDAGGSHDAFVRLRSALDAAMDYCRSRET